jgi:hypothetical protein
MICGSVIWPKNASVSRLFARPFTGFTRFLRTFVFSPAPVLRSANGEPPSKVMVSSRVSLPAGSASATAVEIKSETTTHSAIGEMRRVKVSS